MERPQLSDEVVAHLRDRIMSGQLRPGERIRLEEVAEHLGVSITPVREALLTLRGFDMVELQPRRGYVVAPLSRQDILDVFEVQAHIAGELAARVAGRAGPAELAELAATHKAIRRAAQGRRVAELEQGEFEFHRALNRIASARKLSWLLHAATRYTPARFLSSDPAWRAGMLADHEALLAALAAPDPGAAREAMARHFTDGADRIVKHLDDLGVWAGAER